jgi:hypothetical protein
VGEVNVKKGQILSLQIANLRLISGLGTGIRTCIINILKL